MSIQYVTETWKHDYLNACEVGIDLRIKIIYTGSVMDVLWLLKNNNLKIQLLLDREYNVESYEALLYYLLKIENNPKLMPLPELDLILKSSLPQYIKLFEFKSMTHKPPGISYSYYFNVIMGMVAIIYFGYCYATSTYFPLFTKNHAFPTTLREARKIFKALSFQHHPDKLKDSTTFTQLADEYERIKIILNAH